MDTDPTLIALTTTLEPHGGEYRRPMVAVYANYLRGFSSVGLTSVLVSPAHEPEDIDHLVRRTSGLVLTGGEDVEPRHYGEDPIPELGEVNPGRDAMEWRALEVALDAGLPVLGICRGMQLLNVYFGGTLYQDLEMQVGGMFTHLQDKPWGEHQHEVRCTPGSWIHEALGDCEPIAINSFHHQAVKDLAPNLRCTAQAEDGLIEGIESTEHEYVVGVQWHPERYEAQAEDTDPNIQLMRAFADHVRREAAV